MLQIDYDIDDFLTYCEVKNLSIKTIASYEQTLRLFAQYLKQEFKIEEAGQVKEIHIINDKIRMYKKWKIKMYKIVQK